MTTTVLAMLAVPREGGSGTAILFAQMAAIFAIFYFLLIRPQMKERQKHERMLQTIKKGDEIVTNGGLIGKVVHADEQRLTLRTGENTRVTVDRSRIANVLESKGQKKDA